MLLMLNKKKNPCYLCTDRHEHCHAKCELYSAYKAGQDEIKATPFVYIVEMTEYERAKRLRKWGIIFNEK